MDLSKLETQISRTLCTEPLLFLVFSCCAASFFKNEHKKTTNHCWLVASINLLFPRKYIPVFDIQQLWNCLVFHRWFHLFISFILAHFLFFIIIFQKFKGILQNATHPQHSQRSLSIFKQQANSSLRGWGNCFPQYPTQSVPKIARYFVRFYSSL